MNQSQWTPLNMRRKSRTDYQKSHALERKQRLINLMGNDFIYYLRNQWTLKEIKKNRIAGKVPAPKLPSLFIAFKSSE